MFFLLYICFKSLIEDGYNYFTRDFDLHYGLKDHVWSSATQWRISASRQFDFVDVNKQVIYQKIDFLNRGFWELKFQWSIFEPLLSK